MFLKSSLLPSGDPCATMPDEVQWFGWSIPFPIPGKWNNGKFWGAPDIWIGLNPLGAFGNQFSFSGGRYLSKWTSPQLAVGSWRIYVYWPAATAGLFNVTPHQALIDQITDLLTYDCLSLSDIAGLNPTQLTLLKPSTGIPGLTGLYPDNTYHWGGLDGCTHLYDQVLIADDVNAVRGIDVLIGTRQQLCIQCKVSSRFNEAFALMDSSHIFDFTGNRDYANHIRICGYFLSGCQCGQFLKSSLAFGY